MHEVLRRAVPARGREVARDLVAPGAVEGVLHHGHELHVREARVLEVFRKIGGQLAVGERTVVLLRRPSPGPHVEFVHGEGRPERIPGVPLLHPLVVAPVVSEVPDEGGGAGRRLPGKREGIALVAAVAVVTGYDVILVQSAVADAGDEPFPDARAVVTDGELMAVVVPAVEVADHRDPGRVRRPDREERAVRFVDAHEVRAQLLVEPEMVPFLEEVDIMLRQQAHAVDDVVVLFRTLVFHGQSLRIMR